DCTDDDHRCNSEFFHDITYDKESMKVRHLGQISSSPLVRLSAVEKFQQRSQRSPSACSTLTVTVSYFVPSSRLSTTSTCETMNNCSRLPCRSSNFISSGSVT